MSKRITKLEDARAMKAMGKPLNTPVIDRGMLPARCDKLIIDTIKAAGRCREAVYAFIEDQSEKNYSKLKRAHEKLGREIAKVLDSADDDEQLAIEKAIARARVEPRCFTAYQKWADIIAMLESGDPVQVTAADVWPTETDRA
jgi:hypothetical protein